MGGNLKTDMFGFQVSKLAPGLEEDAVLGPNPRGSTDARDGGSMLVVAISCDDYFTEWL